MQSGLMGDSTEKQTGTLLHPPSSQQRKARKLSQTTLDLQGHEDLMTIMPVEDVSLERLPKEAGSNKG